MKIILIFLVLFVSISAVSAEGSFTDLQDEIESGTDNIELNQDYVFDSSTDEELTNGTVINKENLIINGNGHTIDAREKSRIFNIEGNNITLMNINFINGKHEIDGGAIYSSGELNIINSTFKNNNANEGGAIRTTSMIYIENSTFDANWG